MTAVVLSIPSLSAWADGYAIGQFLRTLAPHWRGTQEVAVSFSRCTFLSAEGAAILAVFKLSRDFWGGVTTLQLVTASQEVAEQLSRWQVSTLFGVGSLRSAVSAVPILHQTTNHP